MSFFSGKCLSMPEKTVGFSICEWTHTKPFNVMKFFISGAKCWFNLISIFFFLSSFVEGQNNADAWNFFECDSYRKKRGAVASVYVRTGFTDSDVPNVINWDLTSISGWSFAQTLRGCFTRFCSEHLRKKIKCVFACRILFQIHWVSSTCVNVKVSLFKCVPALESWINDSLWESVKIHWLNTKFSRLHFQPFGSTPMTSSQAERGTRNLT